MKKEKKKGILTRFLPYYKPYLKVFFLDLFCAFVVAAAGLAFPMLVRTLLNDVIGSEAGFELSAVLAIGGVMLFIKLVETVCYYYVTNIGHVMGARIETDMRSDLFVKFMHLPHSFYDDAKVGTLMSRITSDLFDITELSHHGPEEIFIASVKIIGSFVILSSVSLPLTLIIFAILPLMAIFAYIYNKKMRAAFLAQRVVVGEINAGIEDSLSGIRVVKSFANEEIERTKFEEGNQRFLGTKKDAYRHMGVFHSGIKIFDGVMYLVCVLAGALFIVDGKITSVDLVTYLLYVQTLLSAIMTLVQFTEQFQRGMTGFSRFLEIMDTPITITDENGVEAEKLEGKVEFEKVSFAYSKNLEDVLEDVNLTVQRGETVAIVGPSGGGKTTLCNLIPRFYDVSNGEIKIDGTDIRDFTMHSLRENIGIVQQDVYLFYGTVKENILYGRPGATDEEVFAAARAAGAESFILGLKDGYDTIVGERGVKLSGGQKQRISIARVFLKNPPIIILDEATSALDNESERIVQASLERLAQGRTTFIIAHRLSTIQNASRILVLTEEGIVEEGTHESLLKKKGIYYNLYYGE